MERFIHNEPMQRSNRGRSPQATAALENLKKMGVFRVADAVRAGISQPSLSRLVSEGKINRVESGLYLHPKSPIPADERDYAVACAKFGPKAAIGGMTALSHYNLIEQVPHRIWVMVPYETRSKQSLYRCVRTQTNPQEGIDEHGTYRITNLERTLVEAFRYASKIGLRIAFHAARTAIKEKRTTLEKIHRQAKRLKLEKFIERYWESLISESQAA